MKFSCEKALLLPAITTASRATAPKSSIPALEGILLEASAEIMQTTSVTMAAASQSSIQVRYVCIVVSVVPIMLVVPFVQKYLVEGTMLGAVKG